MPNILAKIFRTGAEKLVTAVTGGLDSLITNEQERQAAKLALQQEINRSMEVLAAQANDLEKAYLADVANARDSNAKIQGDKPSWMAKNIAYIIDIFVTILWGGLTTYIVCIMLNFIEKDQGADYTSVLAVWGSIMGIFATVLSFHRGSSQGSQDKQKLIDKMQQKH